MEEIELDPDFEATDLLMDQIQDLINCRKAVISLREELSLPENIDIYETELKMVEANIQVIDTAIRRLTLQLN